MQCNEQLRDAVASRLAAFSQHRRAHVGRTQDGRAQDTGETLRRAAVAVTIVDEAMGADLPGLRNPSQRSDSAALLLTRRSAKLRNHPGQWAFPGGRIDAGESEIQTALREMREEVGVNLGEETVLGVLDDFITRSGFTMTPIVVWAGPGRGFDPNPGEVESVHRIPLEEFLREDAPKLVDREGSEHPVLRMPVGDDYIAAPTAAIIYQFREVCLLGKHTRVAHYEQPDFAWR